MQLKFDLNFCHLIENLVVILYDPINVKGKFLKLKADFWIIGKH